MCGVSFIFFDLTTKKIDFIIFGEKSEKIQNANFKDNRLLIYVKKVNGIVYGYFKDDFLKGVDYFDGMLYIDFGLISSISLFFSSRLKRPKYVIQNENEL